VEKKLKLI